jgi:hypothetical protein
MIPRELGKEIQEWLCLASYHVAIDGEVGPATTAAARVYFEQQQDGGFGTRLTPDASQGVWGIALERLRASLYRAMNPAFIAPLPSLPVAIVSIANAHLREHPREIGGDNMGPWVRLYMNGNEGRQWYWCAGFVTYVVRQAVDATAVLVPVTAMQDPSTPVGYVPIPRTNPVPRAFSCDIMAEHAQASGRLETKIGGPRLPAPGWVFLHRRAPGDWDHTGIVTEAFTDHFLSVEGNTNDDGSRNGYEVCARRRGYKNMDFIRVD